MTSMSRSITIAIPIAVASCLVLAAQTGSHEARAKEIFKQLVEINTTHSVGDTTKAAEAMAARFKAAGFSDADVRVLGPSAKRGNLVVRYRGTGAKRPMVLMAHLDVVEAKREDWSMDPFVLTEKDGYFYGRGTGRRQDDGGGVCRESAAAQVGGLHAVARPHSDADRRRGRRTRERRQMAHRRTIVR
jgi:hypothetical protein